MLARIAEVVKADPDGVCHYLTDLAWRLHKKKGEEELSLWVFGLMLALENADQSLSGKQPAFVEGFYSLPKNLKGIANGRKNRKPTRLAQS